MKLSLLLEGIDRAAEPDDCEISRVTADSRTVEPGDVFVSIKGKHSDGHDHAGAALAAGAAAVVCERDLGLERQVLVENSRRAYALMCANLCGNPQRDLTIVGVTGTSGKTTVTCLIRDILRAAGKKTGLIGTIQGEIGDMIIPARHTTPDPAQLYEMLARMKAAGMEYVVMEVSSFALDQQRVDGIRFKCAAFTNLSREHLDYHGDMEEYYAAKRSLFSMTDEAVVGIDDEYGKRLAQEAGCPCATFSVSDGSADYSAHSISFSAAGSRFVVVHGNQLARVGISMPGLYSVSNALCAYVCARRLGVESAAAVKGLCESRGVQGRMEIIDADLPFTIIRDYAHAPEELRSVLSTVHTFAAGRIVTLFGCPGERDRGKRPDMARAAAKFSDQVILTSDNPRSENPMQIIEDAMPGFEGRRTPVEVIPDRYDAIRWAIENAKENDTLLLLGKGHEDYQVLSYGTIFFDERFIVKEIVQHLREQDTI